MNSSYSDSSFNSLKSDNYNSARCKFRCPLIDHPHLDRERLLKEIVREPIELPKLKINDPNRFSGVNTTAGYPAAVPISSITDVTSTFYSKIQIDPFRPVHIPKSISTISLIAISKRREYQLRQKNPNYVEDELSPFYQSLQRSKKEKQRQNEIKSIEDSFMINGIKSNSNCVTDALYIPSTYIRKNVSELTPITAKPTDNHSKLDILPSLPCCTHDLRSNPYLKEKEELPTKKYKWK